MSPTTDWDRLVGYAGRLSARPGERIEFMVSAADEPAARLVALPAGGPVEAAVEPLGPVGPREVALGSYVRVPHHPAVRPDDGLAVSVCVWIAPGAPGGRRRALISTWGGGDGWALALDADGRPRFEVGAGDELEAIDGELRVEPGSWARLEAELDPRAATISLTHSRRAGRRLATVEGRSRPCALPAAGAGPGELLIGAELRDVTVGAHLDGKLDAPLVRSGPGGRRTVASWSLGEGRRRRVVDSGPLGLHGRCVNGPLRAVTGESWRGDVHDWRLAPDQYGAMRFASDAVDDLGWPATHAVELPATLRSGVYALELEAGGVVDRIPVAVRRPAGAPPAPYAVLLPTFTYLAYSCERQEPARVGSAGPEDRWVAARGLRSLYDRHADGGGVCEASLLRPLTQMRPGYRCPQHGGPHGLAQDLILLGWLPRQGIEHEVLTDHDLDRDGAAALGSRTLVTGAHPEYASARLLDAIDAHLESGGNLAYLGGNGLNGSVSVDPERPHVIELRRTETNGLAWQAGPGEHHHASGEHGGDWRRRGRPEHRTLGVGLCGFGSGEATAYVRPAEEDPAAAIVFDGLEQGEPVGAPGSVRGGAAGYEIDSHDRSLGSPWGSAVLASAPAPEGTHEWPDDVVYDPGAAPAPRADLVLVRRPEGGAVFSVGSIAWTGCLAGDDGNPISRVTANALAELGSERPFRGDDG